MKQNFKIHDIFDDDDDGDGVHISDEHHVLLINLALVGTQYPCIQ
jgi:hypothetical protein